jgi:hypothetical protein
MEEVIVRFTKQDVANLIELLSRVQLTGKEVPAYVQIVNKVSGASAEKNKEEG